MFKRIGVVLLAVTIWSFCLELGEQFAIPGLPSFVSRRGSRRPPLDADECRRRRATDLASLCGRGLLLGERCVPTDGFQPRKLRGNCDVPNSWWICWT